MFSTAHPPFEPADAAAPGILDIDHLRQQTLGDGALEADLLALFSVQARSILQDLTPGSPDVRVAPSRQAELLHLLCGSARTIGAWDVALHAQTLEGEARGAAASRRDPPAGLPGLAHAIHRACQAIDQRSAAADPSPLSAATTRR